MGREPSTSTSFTGAVLAGGKARRFGSDKCLHPYRGQRLLDYALASLADANELLVVGRSPVNGVEARRIPDDQEGLGVVSGLHAALQAARNDWVAVVGCDMPFLPKDVWSRLFASSEGVRIVMPEGPDGLEPLAALYHRSVLIPLEQQMRRGAFPVRDLLDSVESHVIPWQDLAPHLPNQAFLNANRPEDLP